ncbi:MAG: NAD-dependent epimerase/dehydratase family protein [Chloroflexi bacterium]|nr:NAD-dependent epimerase/dehydratase family protein [Chloroflexota bacterium]
MVRRLSVEPEVEKVLALDVRPGSYRHDKVFFQYYDVAEPAAGLLRREGVNAVIHLAFVLRPSRRRERAQQVNLKGTQKVLEECLLGGVRHILYLSSGTVYGAYGDHRQPLKEEAPLRPNRGFQYAEDKVVVEGYLKAFTERHAQVTVTVLRSCVVMGPGAENFITQAFRKPMLIGIRGQDPPMQFLHQDDLSELMMGLLMKPVAGVFNVAGEGSVRYSELVRLSGRRCLWLPAAVAYALTGWTWSLGLQGDSPAVGLDLIRWPWMVDMEKVGSVAGFHPRHTSREALASYFSQGE